MQTVWLVWDATVSFVAVAIFVVSLLTAPALFYVLTLHLINKLKTIVNMLRWAWQNLHSLDDVRELKREVAVHKANKEQSHA